VSVEVFLGYFTGLGFLGQEFSRSTMIGTALFVHFLDGILCRLFASNSGYSKNLWTVIGCLLGVWAIVILVLLPKRERA
jgi:hypothetical protein